MSIEDIDYLTQMVEVLIHPLLIGPYAFQESFGVGWILERPYLTLCYWC